MPNTWRGMLSHRLLLSNHPGRVRRPEASHAQPSWKRKPESFHPQILEEEKTGVKRRLLWIVSDIQTPAGPQTREFCGLAPHHLYSQHPSFPSHPTTPRIQAFTSPFPPNFPPKIRCQAARDSLLARIDNTARSIVTSLILRRTGPSVVSPRVRPEPAGSGAAPRVRIPARNGALTTLRSWMLAQ